MSADPPLNWVQRRKKKEERLASGLDELWRDIRAALEDASRSLKELYGFESDTEKVNTHRFRVKISKTATQSTIREVELDFDQSKRIVKVEFIGGSRPSHQYVMSADSESTFLLDGNAKITADDISQQILEPIFFERPIGFRSESLGY